MENEKQESKLKIFVRVLPLYRDEWVAFDYYNSNVKARLARDILKESNRFTAVEIIPQSAMRRIEGVDAQVLAETQIAGAWPPREQAMVRETVDRKWKTLWDGENRGEHDYQSAIRLEKYEFVYEGLKELIELMALLIGDEPVNRHDQKASGFPRRAIIAIQNGERDPNAVIGRKLKAQ